MYVDFLTLFTIVGRYRSVQIGQNLMTLMRMKWRRTKMCAVV